MQSDDQPHGLRRYEKYSHYAKLKRFFSAIFGQGAPSFRKYVCQKSALPLPWHELPRTVQIHIRSRSRSREKYRSAEQGDEKTRERGPRNYVDTRRLWEYVEVW